MTTDIEITVAGKRLARELLRSRIGEARTMIDQFYPSQLPILRYLLDLIDNVAPGGRPALRDIVTRRMRELQSDLRVDP